MKSTIIVSAACLLTAGLVLGSFALGINLKDGSGKPFSSDVVSGDAAVYTETGPDVLMDTAIASLEEASANKVTIKNPGSIVIPGFEKLTLKAGLKEQNVQLYNPNENSCYFMITILLADGTELFQSELLAPGSSLNKIKLSRIPEPGIYEDAMLRYSCFDMETLKGLNGANTKFILEVAE